MIALKFKYIYLFTDGSDNTSVPAIDDVEENDGEDEEDIDSEDGDSNEGGDNPWDIDGDEDEGAVEPVEPSGAAFGQVNLVR